MRVSHVITRLIVGGAQENTIASVLGLRARPDLDVDLISGPTTGPEGSLENSVRQAAGILTIVPELVRPIAPLKDWIALRKLTAIFRRTRPSIVHTHSGKAGILGRLAARNAGVPIVIHTIHGPSFGEFQGALPNFVFRGAERYAARFTTHFVAVANAMTTQYLGAGIGRPDNYTRVFSGFELQPFLSAANDPALRERYGIKPQDFVIGKVARLFQLKGHDDLLEVAPAIVKAWPSARFLLVGGGEWRERFERLVRESGLGRHVIFAGLVPPSEIAQLMGIMDVIVHLSLREGLARALPQALAAGKPVVSYDCDGAAEVCLEGETGFLVRPGDLNTLSDRILQLARDPALRLRLGRQGRLFVEQRFSVETMIGQLEALYWRLAREQGIAAERGKYCGAAMTFPFNVYLIAFASAGLTTFLSMPLWRRWSQHIGLVDDPGHRKIHDCPVALAGGLAVLTGLIFPVTVGLAAFKTGFLEPGAFPGASRAPGLELSGWLSLGMSRRGGQLAVILLGAIGMVILGWFDDKYELSPGTKFGGQFLIAALVAMSGIRITLFVHNAAFSYAITILWILTMTNALNFMDNMNGLCAGLGAISAWFFAWASAAQGQYLVALIAFLTCGALLGFLPYNFPKASVFLGDAGSHLIGYLLSILAILPHFYSRQNPNAWAVLRPLLILAIPLADLAWVVLLRWRKRQPIYLGDTNHLSHRLVRRGWSKPAAVLVIWLLAALAGATSFFGF